MPKAYINYIFLDEQFKYAGAGNFSRVGISGTVKEHWYTDAVQLQNISVPKNGYIFVYVSNESNLYVFFDNLQVIHKPGPILEETHYYPFGLTMAGISSKAAGGLINRKKFNDATELQSVEFSDGSGLELYATNFRSLDPQIGRFCQIDPLAMASVSLSLYQYANNNPILINDPLGLIGDTVWKKLPVVTVTAIKVNKVILIPEVHNTFFGTYTTYRYPEAIQKAARADAGNFLARWTPLGKAIYALNSLLDILDKNIVFASKSVDDLKKEGSLEGTTGNGTEIITKEGGMEQADRDFNDVTVSGSSKSNPNIPGGRIGKTPNGKTVNVRNTSSDGRPTLEVYNSKTRTTEIKIRYE